MKWGTVPLFYTLALIVYQVMTEDFEIRRVQAYSGEKSLTFVLPKIYSEKLGIGKGNFLKVRVDGTKLIVEKADF